jgi:cytochrome b6-f complex iron-sulfur subunit
MTETDGPPTRRTFLDWMVALGAGVTGAAMAIPGLLYLWPAASGSGVENVEVEGAADMSPGQSKTIQVGGKAVIVVRLRAGFRAFSAACTHLGCLVKWEASRREFLCPCHAAVFDENGGVVSGPPPSALPPYTVKEIGDKVYVSA